MNGEEEQGPPDSCRWFIRPIARGQIRSARPPEPFLLATSSSVDESRKGLVTRGILAKLVEISLQNPRRVSSSPTIYESQATVVQDTVT